ncbi:unnamed protein product [Adineta ricciae]|uniref:Uncharacterized protein n=1 Tax=Adineta ricciae TaxID=249248 RepID=A0A815J8H4_ADIRI|nr:unnamed protein product [Adineta ricciae]CAF1644938.1 unnamed protein product [Adineta ricciae]
MRVQERWKRQAEREQAILKRQRVGLENIETWEQKHWKSRLKKDKDDVDRRPNPEHVHDRCYCTSCYGSERNDVLFAGGAHYVIPRGWIRLGVCVHQVKQEHFWRSITRWFHLTHSSCGHISGQYFIYTSSTIAYADLPVYAPSYDFTSNEVNRYKVKFALVCRQDPELMNSQAETMDSQSRRICPHIPYSDIEYFIKARASLVTYDLLLHMKPIN